MTESIEIGNDLKETKAKKQIAAFQARFGDVHLEFARRAAFPLALTPDLLYRLRDYLLHDDEEILQVPWIAVSDLLLSGLCSEVDEELYEMDITVRKELLKNLSQQYLCKLSTNFLLKYVKRNFQSKIVGLKQSQRWTALAYVNPGKAAKELTRDLSKLLQRPNLAQWLQKSLLVETLAEPLQADFQPLLILAKAMKQTALGHYAEATDLFESLGKTATAKSVLVGEVEVNLPSSAIPVNTFTFQTVTVNAEGEIIPPENKTAPYFTENLEDDITLDMVYIPRGRFLMGAAATEAESYDDERPQHQVTVKPFLMGKYPVTQAQWLAVAKLPKIQYDLKLDPSRFKGENLPVESISWYHAVEFCARLSRHTGKSYRLPSEAEWEYACRARTTTPFHFGETITTDLANYDGTDDKDNKWSGSYGQGPKGIDRQETTPVGSFEVANAFGLYDMHGNVWEWCADPWHDSYDGAPTDGTVWDKNCNDNRYQSSIDLLVNSEEKDNQARLLRGGSWYSNPRNCRSACRYYFAPGIDYYAFGFRVVCVAAWT